MFQIFLWLEHSDLILFCLESLVLELRVEDERNFVRLLVLVLVLGRNGEMKIRLLPHGR